jgi:hypothetical protein
MGKKFLLLEHLIELQKATVQRHHTWIDSLDMLDLTVSSIVDKFPFFKRSDIVIEELWLLLGNSGIIGWLVQSHYN